MPCACTQWRAVLSLSGRHSRVGSLVCRWILLPFARHLLTPLHPPHPPPTGYFVLRCREENRDHAPHGSPQGSPVVPLQREVRQEEGSVRVEGASSETLPVFIILTAAQLTVSYASGFWWACTVPGAHRLSPNNIITVSRSICPGPYKVHFKTRL